MCIALAQSPGYTATRVGSILSRWRWPQLSDQVPRLQAVPSKPSLDDLLRLVGAGSEEAFAALYDQVAGKVFGLATRVLRDRAQAEEVSQEALLEVWRKAPRFDSTRGSARAWIMTIAHHRAVDRVRAEQSSRDRQQRAAMQDDEQPDLVAEAAETAAEREQVRHAIGQLTDLQREALELAYYGGHTYRKVAEMLDVPLGTVKSRLRDGLTRLRDVLEEPL